MARSLTKYLALGNRRQRTWAKGVLPLLVKGLTLGDLFRKAFGNVFWTHFTSAPIELGQLNDYARAYYYLIDCGVIPLATIVSVLGAAMDPQFRQNGGEDNSPAPAGSSDVCRLVESLGYILLSIETKSWDKSTFHKLYSPAMLQHAALVYESNDMHALPRRDYVPHLTDPSVVLAIRQLYSPKNNRYIRLRRSVGARSQSLPPSPWKAPADTPEPRNAALPAHV